MRGPTCSSGCREAHRESAELVNDLRARRWLRLGVIAASCGAAYLAYTARAWLWILAAFMAWYGTYQTIYSKSCGRCGAAFRDGGSDEEALSDAQRGRRRWMAHGFLGAAAALGLTSVLVLPLLWPVAAVAGWFAASFYVAAATRYVGCPEVGAIPSWLLGRRIATRCGPLQRIDARFG